MSVLQLKSEIVKHIYNIHSVGSYLFEYNQRIYVPSAIRIKCMWFAGQTCRLRSKFINYTESSIFNFIPTTLFVQMSSLYFFLNFKMVYLVPKCLVTFDEYKINKKFIVSITMLDYYAKEINFLYIFNCYSTQ